MKGADPGGPGERGELDGTGFGDHGRAAWAVGGDRGAVALGVGVGHVAQAGGSAARTGAADGEEAEVLHRSGDEFAVEARRDEDGNALVAKAVGAHQQDAMPEGENDWAGDFDADGDAGGVDVLVTQSGTKQADQQRGKRRG